MELYMIIFMFILGTIFGSFFNVVGYRVPIEQSIVKPSSHCPECNYKLKFLDLIPIFSYIFLLGKCRNCKTKIPIFYLVFELITGLLFAYSYYVFGFTPALLVSLIFISTLIISIISDIKYLIILDEVLIISGLLLILINLFIFNINILLLFLNIIIPVLALLLLKLSGDYIFKKESMGWGDIKLMGIFGIVLGWELSILVIFLSAVVGFPFAIIQLLKSKNNILPYGPYLSIAALIVYFSRMNIKDFIDILLVR